MSITQSAWVAAVQKRWFRRAESTVVAVIFVTGLWFLFGQLAIARFRVVPGDLGDGRWNAILLEHGFRFLRGDAWHRALWSPNWSFYPHENVLAYSDNLLGTLPLYAIFRALHCNEMAAYDAWAVAMAIGNFLAMYAFLRAVDQSRIGAALGGFVFAFSMPRGEQLNHLQLFPHCFTPLCFYFLTRLRTLRPSAVWGAVACAVLQLYAGIYLGWFLGLALGICATVTLVMALASRQFRNGILFGLRRLWVHSVVAMVAGAVSLLPLVIHYARAQAEVGPRSFSEMVGMLPRPLSYFLPADYTWLYRTSLLKIKPTLPVSHEQVMFTGFLVLLCAVAELLVHARRQRPIAEHWWQYSLLSVWIITVIATLWIDGSLWQYLYRILPGAGGIRAVARIALLQLLPLGAAAAWAATWVQKRLGLAVVTVLAALVVLENSGTANYHFTVSEHSSRVHRIETELLAENCRTFLLVGAEDPYKIHMDALWASLETQTPTLNGFSGNIPPEWPFETPRTARLLRMRSWLGRHNANTEGLCLLRH